jgi:hypothetical protein
MVLMSAAKRLWPAYPWRLVSGLALLGVAGWFFADVLTRDSSGIVAKALFGATFGGLALFALQLVVGHIALTDVRLETRGIGRRVRVNRADVVAFPTRPYNRSFLISVECKDRARLRLPLLIQGSRRSQERLLRELERWAFPERGPHSSSSAPG